jgi:hypothetical protein
MNLRSIVIDYRLYITPDITTIVFLIIKDIKPMIGILKKDFLTLFQQFYDRSSEEYLLVHTPIGNTGHYIIMQISQAMISDIIDDLLPTLVEQ